MIEINHFKTSFLSFAVHVYNFVNVPPVVPYFYCRSQGQLQTSMVNEDYNQTSSLRQYITIAKRKGLKADPCCSPTCTLNSSVTLKPHLTTVVVHALCSSNILLGLSRGTTFSLRGIQSQVFSRFLKIQCSHFRPCCTPTILSRQLMHLRYSSLK